MWSTINHKTRVDFSILLDSLVCYVSRKAENCHGGDFGGAESMCARSKLWRGKSGAAPNREFLVFTH